MRSLRVLCLVVLWVSLAACSKPDAQPKTALIPYFNPEDGYYNEAEFSPETLGRADHKPGSSESQAVGLKGEQTWTFRFANFLNGCPVAPRRNRVFRFHPAQEGSEHLPVLYLVNGTCSWYDDANRSNVAELYRNYKGAAYYVDGPDVDGSLSEAIMFQMRNFMIKHCQETNQCLVHVGAFSRGAYIVNAAFYLANNWLRDRFDHRRIQARLSLMIDPVNTLVYAMTHDTPGMVLYFKKTTNWNYGIFANGPLRGLIHTAYVENLTHGQMGSDKGVGQKAQAFLDEYGVPAAEERPLN